MTGPGVSVPAGATPWRIGIVGAGPWATLVHAPMFASHPRTTLAGVWARRPDAAAQVATANGSRSFATFAELLDHCDAVSFAVPPDVQGELALTAAKAGKAVLLEKPLALGLEPAIRLVDAIDESRVASQVLLTWRYADAVRTFLADVSRAQPIGGRGHFFSGAFLGGPFATPWRLEQGPLLDLGPHVIDLLDAALGTVTSIRAHGDVQRWVGLLLEHESGLTSEVSLSGSCPVEPARCGAEIYTRAGVLEVDTAQVFHRSTFARVVDEFVDHLDRPGPHALDAHRGLHLQRLLTAALDDL